MNGTLISTCEAAPLPPQKTQIPPKIPTVYKPIRIRPERKQDFNNLAVTVELLADHSVGIASISVCFCFVLSAGIYSAES